MTKRITKVDKISIRFGQNVKTRRERLGISQEKLEVMSGVNRGTISNIETGSTGLSLWNAYRLAESLNTTLNAMVGK